MTRWTGRCWFSSASSTSGSHRAPSWLTRTAVTTWWRSASWGLAPAARGSAPRTGGRAGGAYCCVIRGDDPGLGGRYSAPRTWPVRPLARARVVAVAAQPYATRVRTGTDPQKLSGIVRFHAVDNHAVDN